MKLHLHEVDRVVTVFLYSIFGRRSIFLEGIMKLISPDSFYGIVLLFGALGAVCSYIFDLFGGFKRIPSEVPDQRFSMVRQRLYFFMGRIAFGVSTALISSMFLMESYFSGDVSKYQLFGCSAVAGFSAPTLSQLASYFRAKFTNT